MLMSVPGAIARFVRWYSGQEVWDFDEDVTHDFILDDGLECSSRADFLAFQRGRGPIEGLTILDSFATANRAAVMFEGIDSVTGLFHRFCWMFVLEGEQIKRISTCHANLLKPEDRPIWK